MSLHSSTSESTNPTNETKSNVESHSSKTPENTTVVQQSTQSSDIADVSQQNVLNPADGQSHAMPSEVQNIVRHFAESGGTLHLTYAPQVTNQNQIYQSPHYDLRDTTGNQFADTIINQKGSEENESSPTPSNHETSSQNEEELSEKEHETTEYIASSSSASPSQSAFRGFDGGAATSSKRHKKKIKSSSSECTASSFKEDERQRLSPQNSDKNETYRYSSCSNLESLSTHEKEIFKADTEILQMKMMLDERANEESGKMTYPIKANLAIIRVPLQLSTKVERSLEGMDRHGHYNKRCDFENVMKKTESDVMLRDIFTRAKQRAKEKSKQQTNATAKRKFVERHGNIVGMIGQAGIGKTTLCRMLLQSVIEGEMLPETQFMFYIPFREVVFVNEITLMKFALTGCFGWEHTVESDRKLLKVLQSNENVVFIFDGLDEANTDRLSQPVTQCDVYSMQKPDLFVAKILTGDLFPKAKKLITSRPRQFFELHSDYRPKFVLDVLGLNEEAQVELCRQICGESFDAVITYLKSNQDILSCCYVPVNCIITMSIIHKTLKEHGKINLISLTDIFVRALEIFVESDHVRKYRDQVWKLSKLAWDGFLAKKIIFGEADFTDAKIDEAVFQAFLCTYVKGEMRGKILEGKKKSSFSHLTWQELFVAIYLAMFHPFNSFHDIVGSNKLSDPLWEVVSKFLFGLCNLDVMDKLTDILYPQTVNDWNQKTEVLFSFIAAALQNGLSSHEERFRIYSWIREADNTDLNTMIANYVPQQFTFPSSLLLADVVSAVYVLKHATGPFDIRIEDGLALTTIDYLLDQFAALQLKLKSLDVSLNKFGNDGAKLIAQSLIYIEDLALYDCNITSDGAKEIASHLQETKIRSLNLSGNLIEDEGATAIAKHLNKIKELNFRHCDITSHGAKEIANQLKECTLKSLNLSKNKIGDDGARAIANVVSNIDELILTDCDITPIGAEDIASQLKECKLTSLNLYSNTIGDDGARAIAKCLKNIDRIYIGRCGITCVGAEEIASQLKECKITSLDLFSNNIGDKGAIAIAKCLSNVEELDIGGCCITSVGIKEIASKLKKCKMKKLNISWNYEIGDKEGNMIASHLGNLDELNLKCCSLSEDGIQKIKFKLFQLPNPKPKVIF